MVRILVAGVLVLLAAAGPAMAQRAPDLTVEITGYEIGQRGHVEALVTNGGRTTAGPSRIDLTIEPPPHGVHFKQLGEVEPGGQLAVRITGTIKSGAELSVMVDSQAEVDESDERNNVARLRVPQDEPPLDEGEVEQDLAVHVLPDLSIEIIDISAGESGTVRARVRNRGESPSGATRIRLERDGERNVYARVPALKPGENVDLELAAPLAEGSEFALIVDPDQKVDESDEGNNRLLDTAPVATEPEPPGDRPDLTVEIAHMKQGADGVVSVIVRNLGAIASPRNRVRLEREGEPDVDVRVPSLQPGAALDLDVAGALNDGTAVVVTVDPDGQVEESDEANNTAKGQVPNEDASPPPDEPGQPEVDCACNTETSNADLVVSIVAVERGDPLKVRAQVRNAGDDTSGIAEVTLTVTSGKVEQFMAKAPALGPGESAQILFSVPLHEPTLNAFVDSGFDVPESNEDNNRSDAVTAPVHAPVVAGPPVAMLNIMPVAIATGLTGGRDEIEGRVAGEAPRKVGVFRYPEGGELVFVEDELVISAEPATAIELAERYDGEIVFTLEPYAAGKPPTFVLRIDPMTAHLDPPETDAREPALVSSERALRLLSIVSDEQRNGLPASMNLVPTEDDVFDGSVFEGTAYDSSAPDPVPFNSALLPYIQAGGVFDVNVLGAWRALEIAQRPTNTIAMAIVDRGFYDVGDLPPTLQPPTSPVGVWPSPTPDGVISLPNHGTKVSQAAAGIYGNGQGTAGSAGRAVRLDLRETVLDTEDEIASVVAAALSGARIISVSRSLDAPHDTGAFFFEYPPQVTEYEQLTIWLRQQGILFFASAGNDGVSVDSAYSDGAEKVWVSPCENQGAICVNGWAQDKLEPDDSSNYGEGSGESVDIAGPYTMLLGPDLDNYPDDIADKTNGTSFSAPFVAGIAAMVWQAKSDLSADQVWQLLDKYAKPGNGIRVVNAYGPVREALMMSGESFAPRVQLASPVTPTNVHPGQDLTLRATAVDVEDGPGCCKLSWVSDVDGDLGEGHEIKVSFAGKPVGPRTITAIATDSSGLSGSTTLVVNLQNDAPKLRVLAPKPHDVLTTGLPYTWKAELVDDSAPLMLPLTDCTGLVWTDMKSGDTLGEGCDINVTFATPGKRYVIASYSDAYGDVASKWFAVDVVDTPADDMTVTLTQPGEGAAYYSTEQIPLDYELIDPGAGPNTTYVVYWQLGRSKTSLKPFKPNDEAGQLSISIADVLKEEEHSTSSGTFLIDLLIIDPARPGVGATAQRTISFLPEIR